MYNDNVLHFKYVFFYGREKLWKEKDQILCLSSKNLFGIYKAILFYFVHWP